MFKFNNRYLLEGHYQVLGSRGLESADAEMHIAFLVPFKPFHLQLGRSPSPPKSADTASILTLRVLLVLVLGTPYCSAC
jgi:hypothetical protein